MNNEKNKGLHIGILVVCIILYIINYLFMGPLKNEQTQLFMGVLTEVNVVLCTIIVTTNQKRGLITTIVLSAFSVFRAVMGVINGNQVAVVGVITPLITVGIAIIIYIFLNKSETQRLELSDQYEKLMDSNRIMQEKDEALRTLAYKDQMTQMNNLSYLREQMEEAINKNSAFALIYMDLDNFKVVNDTFGPRTGDAALKTYADRISSYCGNKYICARTNGDDFAIMIVGEPTEADILNMIEQIRRMFGEPVAIQGANISITASYGIAVHPRDGKNADILIDNAVMAVYNAKANGKDRPCFFSQA